MSRSNLIALLSKQQAQVFVTAIERDALGNNTDESVHVEHGDVTRMT